MAGQGLVVTRLSRWWRSAAWPDPADPPYLNGVAFVETGLSAREVLNRLHAIEAAFGRGRGPANASRTLDLDLIAYGRTISEDPALPHSRAHERRFVMGPLSDIAPGWVHPVSELTAMELATRASFGNEYNKI
jgi:2-amino-4-hydroxy-6-hydroxymethyldihydropteridine diphosphokinase